jgi:hypothetical protein
LNVRRGRAHDADRCRWLPHSPAFASDVTGVRPTPPPWFQGARSGPANERLEQPRPYYPVWGAGRGLWRGPTGGLPHRAPGARRPCHAPADRSDSHARADTHALTYGHASAHCHVRPAGVYAHPAVLADTHAVSGNDTYIHTHAVSGNHTYIHTHAVSRNHTYTHTHAVSRVHTHTKAPAYRVPIATRRR